MNKRGFPTAILLLVLIFPVSSQEEADPVWLMYHTAVLQMEQGEYGEALRLFNILLERKAIYPEVEMALGDIFLIEGETALAERHYLKAYNQKTYLEIPDDSYTILYRLANLYQMELSYVEWANSLDRILKENQQYYEDIFGRNQDSFLKVFRESGFFRLLQLYRVDHPAVGRAHSGLGEFHYRTGRYEPEALVHYLFALIAIFSEAIDALLDYDSGYRFDSLENLLKALQRRDRIREYLVEERLYENLYYLAASASAAGYEEQARDLWQSLLVMDDAGRFSTLAEKQLASPWVDPLYSLDAPPDVR